MRGFKIQGKIKVDYVVHQNFASCIFCISRMLESFQYLRTTCMQMREKLKSDFSYAYITNKQKPAWLIF